MTTQLPPYQYGGLMVPHPELIHTAGRPKPSWGPVVAWTFFFAIFGVIPAALRAGKAQRAGQAQHPYWIAFGVTLVLAGVFWRTAAVELVSVYVDHKRGAVAESIERELTAEPAANGTRITAADCKPLDPEGPGGNNAYSCHISLSTGASDTVTVLVNSDGVGRIVD